MASYTITNINDGISADIQISVKYVSHYDN